MDQKLSKKRNVDWISLLPEDLIHYILSFLSAVEVARASMLSKTWLHACSTNPNLDFHGKYFRTQEIFFIFVDKTLLRYHKQKLSIHRFRLSMEFQGPGWTPLIDKWMGILVQNRAKVIELQTRYYLSSIELQTRCLYLLQIPFATKSLLRLELRGIKLKQQFGNDSIKLLSLQKLSLVHVYVDEQLFHNILFGCPLIEELLIIYCEGLTKLKVGDLKKLKKVEVEGLNEVEIDATNLQSFECRASFSPTLSIGACRDLKYLHLLGLSVTDKYLENLLSNFPSLENLVLSECWMERVNISSHSLKTLTLDDCVFLVEAKIDAPNLFSVKCYSYDSAYPPVSFTSAPQKWGAYIECIDAAGLASWFFNLRQFVTRLCQYPGCLRLEARKWAEKKKWNVEDLKEMPDLPQLHEIDSLLLPTQSAYHKSFLDGLLWSCHPKHISVFSNEQRQRPINGIVKKLCSMLIQKEECPSCCSSLSVYNKCWRHYLKEVEIVSIGDTKVERPLNRITMSDLLAYVEKEQHGKICLGLKW